MTSVPISDPVTMDDCMITSDTPNASLRQATYGFRQEVLLLHSGPRRPAFSICLGMSQNSTRIDLLVFIDGLMLFNIRYIWGFNFQVITPNDIVHFDIPLLPIPPLGGVLKLRLWIGKVVFVNAKSHTGCLMNQRADEMAKLGWA